MNALIYVGLFIAIGLIAGLAIYTGATAKKGAKTGVGAGVVAGVIMGTLVGGASTVGTAQLAFTYGMSAWWFTLGGGIACLILAIGFIKPLRANGEPTLVGMVGKEYGPTAGMSASILNSVGTFINIISQLLSASAVLLIVWPNLGTPVTVFIAALFMVLYVVFGGTKGAGIVGTLKMVLLYISMIACGVIVISKVGGPQNFLDMVNGFGASVTGKSYFSLFNRGVGQDLGSCFSLILGVLTTQSYAQAVISGKKDSSARAGALISTFLIPPIGIAGIMVGLYMRTVVPDVATYQTKVALTDFILNYSGMPTLLAGIVLGTLFIATVGTGAGLALGISRVINVDILQKISKKAYSAMKSATIEKIFIVLVLLLAAVLSCGSLGDTILNFAFLSMGLRGCTVFAPLCFLIWAKGKVPKNYAIVSIIASPVVDILFTVVPVLSDLLHGWSALFPAIIIGFVIMFIGYGVGRKQNRLDDTAKA